MSYICKTKGHSTDHCKYNLLIRENNKSDDNDKNYKIIITKIKIIIKDIITKIIITLEILLIRTMINLIIITIIFFWK